MAIISTGYSVSCDELGCGVTAPSAPTPGEARTLAHNNGFKVGKYPLSNALCPVHKPKEDE